MRILVLLLFLCWAANANAAPNIGGIRTCFLRGDYSQAARLSEQVLVESAGTGTRGTDEVHYLAGLSYLKLGEYTSAREHFNAVIMNFPSGPLVREANIAVADVAYLEGDFKSARSLYESMARKAAYRDFKPALYGRLRLTALKTGDGAAAAKYAEKLRKQCPLSLEARSTGENVTPAVKHDALAMAQGVRQSVRVPGAPSAQSPGENGHYSVQVGAFGNRANAERLKEKLVSQGYDVQIAQSPAGEKMSYKVRVGREKTRQGAEDLKQELSLQGYPTTMCQ